MMLLTSHHRTLCTFLEWGVAFWVCLDSTRLNYRYSMMMMTVQFCTRKARKVRDLEMQRNSQRKLHIAFCFFHSKNIFMCRKHTKIIFTNIIIQRRFFKRIFRMSTLNENYFTQDFWAKIYWTILKKIYSATSIVSFSWDQAKTFR